MISIKRAVIVEGKYDKMRLSSFIDAYIITTDGFGIFNDKEKRALIKALAEKQGLLVLTDSDRAGFKIRAYLRSIVDTSLVEHAYIPPVAGKEKRKAKMSKDALLGVEGMDEATLAAALAPFCGERVRGSITKGDLYDLGLLGQSASAQKRQKICRALSLPVSMSSNAFLEAVNVLCSAEELVVLCTADEP